MRIISKFKDYYDGAAFQLGEVPLYIRDEKEINYESPNCKLRKFEIHKKMRNELYKFREFYEFHQEYKWLASDRTSIFGIGSEIYLAWNAKYWINNSNNIQPLNSDLKWYNKMSEDYQNKISKVAEYIIDYVKNNREKISIAPVFHWNFKDEYFLVENPILRNFNFATCVDSFSCATLIDTYISNLAINQDIPQKMNDVDMLESKGFSKIFSFRKQKGE